jgi:hypothetical protein
MQIEEGVPLPLPFKSPQHEADYMRGYAIGVQHRWLRRPQDIPPAHDAFSQGYKDGCEGVEIGAKLIAGTNGR